MTGTISSKLAGRRVVASISGGKDSAAMSLHLRELGIDHDRVFLDTGWEHPLTYEYLRGELTRVLGPIAEVRGPRDMVETIRHKGMFPSKRLRFCTQELKVFPMQRHLRVLLDGGADVVNAVGIRRSESQARSKMEEWEWSNGFDCETWRPLVAWSEEEVIAIHRRHGLAPNPLYLMGASRVGCWPCIYARKSEIRLVAEVDPGRIAFIRDLESDIAELAQIRISRRDPGATNARPPSWFRPSLTDTRICEACTGLRHVCGNACAGPGQAASPDDPGEMIDIPCAVACSACGGTGVLREGGACWPIDKVVDWAQTSRGGRQYELFAASPADEGCMRWGLCETDKEDAQ